jgi:2-polyprenyl-6-methoxyphenol hydroxylase-like FAD-dependent oxidoreductase
MSEPSFPNIPAKDSGIHIIIIGLGIVGLAAAIECREKGHTVTAYEKSDILAPVGMVTSVYLESWN